jgi:hypothetical protein
MHTPTRKRVITPVVLTVKVQATRINENGTFSGLTVLSASGPNDTFKASIPPQGGGSIYLKVESLKGVTIREDGDTATANSAAKAKLF